MAYTDTMIKSAHYRITITEMPSFDRQARSFLTSEERAELIGHISVDPTAGDLMQGTGGIRKMRWALRGRGKSGGVRILYFYHDLNMPVYLLAAYSKSQKENITGEEKKQLRQLSKALVKENYKRRGLMRGESS